MHQKMAKRCFRQCRCQSSRSGGFDRLYAYDQGLIAYSGAGKVAYLNHAGHMVRGPYQYTVDPNGIFARASAASATGSLFAVWYTENLPPDGCLSDSGEAVVAKFTPSGLAWQETLPHAALQQRRPIHCGHSEWRRHCGECHGGRRR